MQESALVVVFLKGKLLLIKFIKLARFVMAVVNITIQNVHFARELVKTMNGKAVMFVRTAERFIRINAASFENFRSDDY